MSHQPKKMKTKTVKNVQSGNNGGARDSNSTYRPSDANGNRSKGDYRG
jgi:hypothetical protein